MPLHDTETFESIPAPAPTLPPAAPSSFRPPRIRNPRSPRAGRAQGTVRKTTPTDGRAGSRVARRSRAEAPLDPRVVAELLEVYTPLVRQIAGGFQRKLPRNVLREDLLAAGMSGLWDAIRRHADKPSDSFEWYVRVRIRGAILDELRAQDWLPRRARAAAAEAQEPGAMTRSCTPAVVRLDDVSEWEQNRCLATLANSEAAVDAKFTRETLARAVDQLPTRERHIVAAHYFRGVKFKDLGTELGVSEPRISQLHSRAMQRLRSIMARAA